jgi:hypothetical protein
MTTNNARYAFLRSYHLPAILLHYPRLVRAMQVIAMLNGVEAAACIRDLKAGRRWSSEAVNRYGGTHKVATEAWKYRRATTSSQEALREVDRGMFATEGREG